jgi:serine/threonine protein kinase
MTPAKKASVDPPEERLSPIPSFPSLGDTIRTRPETAQATVSCTWCDFPQARRGRPCPRCGAILDAPKPPFVVDGRYEVESELGRGGMGLVYLAREVWIGRKVAIKIIAPIFAGDSAVTARFRQEAKALAAIRSTNIVQLYASGPYGTSHYFAMEYVRGSSLREILREAKKEGGSIPLYRALSILADVAGGIDAVHAAGLVHRDVKPANILIEEDTGRPVLVDFGLAVEGDRHARTLLGTPRYMAPEQTGLGRYGTAVSPRTDVYALGVTAFELLAGRVPFEGVTPEEVLRQHAEEPAPLLSSVRPDLQAFDGVLMSALAKDPAERYESCAALASALMTADGRMRASLAPQAPPSLPSVGRALRVLVVDDDYISRKVSSRAVQYALGRTPLRIAVAASGTEALERAARELPDLVVLDFDLPGFDGIDVLSRLREHQGGDHVRVVVVSGRVDESERWRFSLLGVNDFVGKPIDLPRFVEIVRGLAARAGWAVDPTSPKSER